MVLNFASILYHIVARYVFRYIAIVLILMIAHHNYSRPVELKEISMDHSADISFPPELQLPDQLFLCDGETLIVDAMLSGVTYLWSDGSQNQTLSITAPGIYSLTVTDATGSDADTIVVIDGGSGPDIELGDNIVGCYGDTVILSVATANATYFWQNGSTGPSLTVTNSGTYSVTVSNACGTDMDQVDIDLNTSPPDAILGKDTVLCEGTTLTLISLPEPGTVSTWQDGSSFNFYTVFAPGTYILSQVNFCGIDSDTINITYGTPPPFINLGADTTLCEGATLLLTAPEGTNMVTWQDGSHGTEFLVTAPGTYSVSVSNRCGTRTNSLEVFYDVDPFTFPAENKITICESEKRVLDVGQAIAAFYQWDTGENTPAITISEEGFYAVTVSTNCKSAEEVFEVLVADCSALKQLYIPNIISPNGDGINDAMNVSIHPEAEIISITGTIYDRWGNVLYLSSGDTFTWNGKAHDRQVLPGTYVYRLEVHLQVKGLTVDLQRSGDITVVR